MERWVEHYSELYSKDNSISDSALETIECLPVMAELDVEPSIEELRKAIKNLPCGNSHGIDGIPPEIVKCGGSVLLTHLHELLGQCWKEGEVPQNMRDSNIINLYKNKGDRSDCNNYRGISLLSIVGVIRSRDL
jgi:hypothetical protein